MPRSDRYVLAAVLLALLILASGCSLLGGMQWVAQPEPTAEPTVAQIPGRPGAPAPVDGDFRADPASVAAATGRPQLIEFFAFW